MLAKARSNSRLRFHWLVSGIGDALFLFFPIVAGVLVFALANRFSTSGLLLVLVLQGFGLGTLHQSATWWHFFDSNSRRFYLDGKNLLWSVILPLVLFPFSIACILYYPALLLTIYLAWTVQHIASQNAGLLQLYRRATAADCAAGNLTMQLRSQYSAAAAFGFHLLQRQLPGGSPLTIPLWCLISFLAFETVFCCVKYLASLKAELKTGGPLNVPAFAFWVLSVLFFLPLEFAQKSATSMLVPLTMHWLQYIGLNTMLVKRKYAQKSRAQHVLFHRPYLLFAGFSFCFVAATLSTLAITLSLGQASTFTGTIVSSALITFALIHYLHDAYIWRFRESFNRQAMLNYILPEPAARRPELVSAGR